VESIWFHSQTSGIIDLKEPINKLILAAPSQIRDFRVIKDTLIDGGTVVTARIRRAGPARVRPGVTTGRGRGHRGLAVNNLVV